MGRSSWRCARAEGDGGHRATDAITHHYAARYRQLRQLRQQGTPVPSNDLWIAALVIEYGASLCRRDAHFGRLAQLGLV